VHKPITVFNLQFKEPKMKVKTQKNSNGTVSINLDENTYSVPNHWFWPQFEANWEPQTFTFLKRIW